MIAAVVDPRGPSAARAALAAMSDRWAETKVHGRAAVARTSEAPAECALLDPRSFAAALRARGSGAFVALEADGEAALLGRGSFGGRSLFYAPLAGGGWLACSRVEPLLAATLLRGRANADHLAAHAAGVADPDVHATALAEVSRVPACSVVRLAPDAEPTTRERARVEIHARDAADVRAIAEELWRLLLAAVERAVEGAKTVAVMVGGGVDSSGLLAAALATARGATRREVLALSLDFDAPMGDRPYRKDLARALGIAPIALPPRDAGPWFASSLVLDAQPYVLGIGPMEQLVFRRAKEHGADVLLSGYLADEILAGDMRALAAEGPLRALRTAAALDLPWPTTARQRLSAYVLRPLLKPLVPRALLARSGERDQARDYPWAGPRMLRKLADVRAWAAGLSAPRTPTERFARFERWSLYTDFADWRAQMESTTGLVRKDPYADEDLLALLASVPQSVVSYEGWYRGLFRVALGGRVPESIRWRRDKSWFEPALAETAEAAGGLRALGDLWRPRALEALGILDAERFERTMHPLFEDPSSTEKTSDLWGIAMSVVACEAFARRKAS